MGIVGSEMLFLVSINDSNLTLHASGEGVLSIPFPKLNLILVHSSPACNFERDIGMISNSEDKLKMIN